VIQGSSIWSTDWKAERASTYGVTEDELQTYYQGRTRLGVAVLPEDVAEAIAFLGGPRSNKSTGNVVNVDGGVTAAYPR
jgi:NAD(P)-dependent dehydrogenase (short-subunit alcohol dehydrogenase family)